MICFNNKKKKNEYNKKMNISFLMSYDRIFRTKAAMHFEKINSDIFECKTLKFINYETIKKNQEYSSSAN